MDRIDDVVMELYNNTDKLRDKCCELANEISLFLCDYIIAQKELGNKGINLGEDIFDDYQGWAESLEDVLNKLKEEGLA